MKCIFNCLTVVRIFVQKSSHIAEIPTRVVGGLLFYVHPVDDKNYWWLDKYDGNFNCYLQHIQRWVITVESVNVRFNKYLFGPCDQQSWARWRSYMKRRTRRSVAAKLLHPTATHNGCGRYFKAYRPGWAWEWRHRYSHSRGQSWFCPCVHHVPLTYTGWAKKSGPFLKVHNSCIWWHRKEINISKCSALYQE